MEPTPPGVSESTGGDTGSPPRPVQAALSAPPVGRSMSVGAISRTSSAPTSLYPPLYPPVEDTGHSDSEGKQR